MIHRTKIIRALESKRGAFQRYLVRQNEQARLVDERLVGFLGRSAAEIDAFLQARDLNWPGARPTAELDRADGLRIPFAPTGETHDAARKWALGVLEGRPTIAVDGSQIAPSKEYSLPVGAVQVGWYVNFHARGAAYVKDVAFEVITPDELEEAEADNAGDGGGRGDGNFAAWYINQRRFALECETLVALMNAHGGPRASTNGHGDAGRIPTATPPVCFFDGSFIISFAGQMLPARAARIASGKFDQPSFEVAMARKDVRLMVEQARRGGVGLFVMPGVMAMFDAAIARGEGALDAAAAARAPE